MLSILSVHFSFELTWAVPRWDLTTVSVYHSLWVAKFDFLFDPRFKFSPIAFEDEFAF